MKLAVVVEDSRLMRAMLAGYLRSLGFDVVEADNGASALELLGELESAARCPDLVVVDWNMPVMDGFMFVKTARKRRYLTDVPILMVSAESDRGSIARALMAGVDEYAVKPVSAEQLASKLTLLGLPTGAEPPTEDVGERGHHP